MATKKPATPKDEKFQDIDFPLFPAIEALDRKDYEYFDNLTDEQQRKFVPFMMTKWMSNVNGKASSHVVRTEHFANTHLFNEHVMKHPKLQWLMLCTVSPKSMKYYHSWIPQISDKISTLKDKPTKQQISEYYTKIYKGIDAETLEELVEVYMEEHKKKMYLANIYPNLKLSDIEILTRLVTDEDIKQYERDRGNL